MMSENIQIFAKWEGVRKKDIKARKVMTFLDIMYWFLCNWTGISKQIHLIKILYIDIYTWDQFKRSVGVN